MAKAKPQKRESDEIKIEPGADKQLASILKKALNTPPVVAQFEIG